MDNEPQPVAASGDGAGAPAQPVEAAQQPAAQPQEPTSQGQPAQADQEYAAWLQSKGLEPDSESAKKAAQMAYNSEKLMSKATQEASELKKSLSSPTQRPQDGEADPMVQEMYQDWKTTKLLNDFKESHSDWMDHRGAMSGLLREAVNTQYGEFTREQLVNAGILTLHDVYLQAKGSTPVDTTQIQAQARQETLQTLANTQRAGGGDAQASNPNPQAPTEDPISAAIRKARG
jgi:hypothetical protein